VGDWTAMSELCFGGWKVAKEDATPFQTHLLGYWYMPHVGAIVERWKKLTSWMTGIGASLVPFPCRALEYDADLVTTHYWKPVLEDIERKTKDQLNTPRSFAEALKAV
jgi:hypothetical protein